MYRPKTVPFSWMCCPQPVKPGHKLLPLAETQLQAQDKKRSKGFARLIRHMYAEANMGHPSRFYSGLLEAICADREDSVTDKESTPAVLLVIGGDVWVIGVVAARIVVAAG
jgi:hypothetical protein